MFYPTATLSAAATLEAHWLTIRAECLALPHHEFTAWPEPALYNRGWDVYGLYADTQALMENCVFCPRTAILLGQLTGVVNAGFSRMAAGTRILPHVGYTSAVLRLHLALQVPAGCGLRVGGERRSWQAGRCLLFDDTVEHEAWNEGVHDRLVLLVDFARSVTQRAA
ncbi:aspartyl/asparaginyl beta-hydroxylase domain-containing protein [Dyella tabacisoli]|uniref:Aspartyl/asparaginyl beta-hydroxylase domain-containing protein n=1 Tax=Dyella tabacisoli TaxID=2282381 RepID=A0A369ULM7_9GAMM|nr:aspartyl/asparaginyl beta-hydroxylase domain-containing protein [Dyella tabacisoli]RDD81407.1 aspartyl/asparaginyl beta-hydroxylase domain-containing protein [Dyella tabacisoli]